MPVTVLVIDDSALIRSLLGEIIRSCPDLELVGAAADPYIAREMIRQFKPDVITLDIEMPRMDGLTFLEKLMAARPTPVVMISTLTRHRAEATLRALELGAVDFIEKPSLGIVEGIRDYANLIVEKILAASKVPVEKMLAQGRSLRQRPASVDPVLPHLGTEKIMAIGASTGGTEAIKAVLLQMPVNAPGIVIAQHMPAGFTRSFAERLNKLVRLSVVEARGQERILPGHVFIAPGDRHLTVVRSGSDYLTRLSDAPPRNRHCPSVDVLFESVADICGKNALGVLLTGMGKDGAQGLLQMHKKGSFTLAQDEQSCVVYGMPKEAVAVGAVDQVKSLNDLADAMMAHWQQQSCRNRV